MLALKNVTVAFGEKKILKGASLNMPPKDCICIMGEGGSGKSTLLKLLTRAMDPASGSVSVDGIDLQKVPPQILQLYRRRLGIVFQEPVLIEHATAEENIALPLELFGAQQSVIKRNVADLLKRLDIADKARALATELSMSERALVGIARAIVTAPMMIIADEPLQHLDENQVRIVTELLLNMHKKGTTLILFSRSEETAQAFGARIVELENGAISEISKPKKQAVKTETHRILEELKEVSATNRNQKPKHLPLSKPSDGKKIRITSIGSGI